MKYKMLKTANGPLGSFMAGQEYDLGRMGLEDQAREWVKVGAAVQVAEEAVEPRAESPESPALPPDEALTATGTAAEESEPDPPKPKPKPRGRPRKKRAKKVS